MSRKISLVVTFLLFIIALCQVDRLFQSKFGTDYPAKAYDLIYFSESKRICTAEEWIMVQPWLKDMKLDNEEKKNSRFPVQEKIIPMK